MIRAHSKKLHEAGDKIEFEVVEGRQLHPSDVDFIVSVIGQWIIDEMRMSGRITGNPTATEIPSDYSKENGKSV